MLGPPQQRAGLGSPPAKAVPRKRRGSSGSIDQQSGAEMMVILVHLRVWQNKTSHLAGQTHGWNHGILSRDQPLSPATVYRG